MTKPKGEPPAQVLFVGDLHCGSTCSPAPKAECRTAEMERLLSVWLAFVDRAKAAAKGTAFVLALGGDLIDQPRHHNNFQTWGTTREQRNAAIALLQPLANIASAVVAVKGTEVHAGADGEDDQTVAEALGAKAVPYTWRMTIGGRRILWSHHITTVPRDVTNQDSGMLATARRVYELSLRGEEKPDLIIGHHCHFSPPPVTRHGITVALTPCWQTSTAYGHKIGTERIPDIGALAYWPAEHRVERWLYNETPKYHQLAKFK